MVNIISKTKKKPRQSIEFFDWAHQEINRNIYKWVGREDSEEIFLSAMDGGLMSVIYEIVQPTDLNLIIKIQDQDSPYGDVLAESVCNELDLNTPKIYYHEVVPSSNAIYVIEVIEKMDIPLLSDYYSKTQDLSIIIKLGESIRILNSKYTNGFGFFKHKNLKGEFSTSQKLLSKAFLNKGIVRSNIQSGNFNRKEVDRFKKKVKDFKFESYSYFCHGDIHLDNCFYDSSKKQIYLYDFNPRGASKMYDLAYFKLKSLARGEKDVWESFIQGYGEENIDEKEMDVIVNCMAFRKCSHWSDNMESKKFKWVYREVKEFLS